MSGINMEGKEIRKGASDSIEEYVKSKIGQHHSEHQNCRGGYSKARRHPLLVVEAQGCSCSSAKGRSERGIKEKLSNYERKAYAQ